MSRNLKSIEVRGFKSFGKVDLELRDLNVIIGANGSGKSNLISLFRFLERLVSQNLQETVAIAGGANRLLFHGRKRTKEIRLGFEFGENSYRVTLKPTADDALVVAQEDAAYGGFSSGEYVVPLARGAKESSLRDEAGQKNRGIAKHVAGAMERWRVHHFHDTSESAPVKRLADLENDRVLESDAGNLAPFLRTLRASSPVAYRQIRDHVRLVAPYFDDFVLEPKRANPSKLLLEWKQRGSSAYFNASSFSDGTLRFICLAALLLQPQLPKLVVIDEPELGLHPYALQVLADLLRAAAGSSQVLLATQSVTLLNQLSVDDIIVAEHDGDGSVLHRPSKKALRAWLDAYSVGELWEKNLLRGRPAR